MATEIKGARDALEKCYEIALQWEADELAGVAGTTDKPEARSASEALLEIERLCKSALSAPPRNCDRLGGDYKILHTAWFDWTGSPSGMNPDGTVKMAFDEWLLALAETRKGTHE